MRAIVDRFFPCNRRIARPGITITREKKSGAIPSPGKPPASPKEKSRPWSPPDLRPATPVHRRITFTDLPVFSGFLPSPIRARTGLRCTSFPERSPQRARIRILQPPVRSKTPGGFHQTGGPDAGSRRRPSPLRRRRGASAGLLRRKTGLSAGGATPQNRPSFHFSVPNPDPE